MGSNIHAESKIKPLWDIESYCKNSDICAAARELRPWLSELPDPVARFVAGEEDVRLPEESVIFNDIEKRIIRTFKPHHRAIHYLHALAIVVSRGNEQGVFNICPPRLPSLVLPEKSPFQGETTKQIALAREFRNAVWTTQVNPDNESEKFMGQILLSAALNGALVYSRHLSALYNAVQGPFQVIDHGKGKKCSFYEFNILYTSQQIPELRRWFIDHFTELLLLRFSSVSFAVEENPKKASYKCWRCMVRFLLHAGIKPSSIPKSLQQFLEIAQAWNWFRLPGFLCSFAARDIVSHSLKPHVWRRFFCLMNSNYESKDPPSTIEYSASITEQDLEETDTDANGPEENEQFVEFTWIKDLRFALKGLDRRAIAQKIREASARQVNSFSMQAIGTKWIGFMIKYRSSSGKHYTLAAIKRYAAQILSRVAGMMDDTDITLLEGDGLVEMYQQLLTDVQSDSYRYKIASGLREFHHFLVEQYHISPVNYREVMGIGSKASRVDANILSIDEFYASMKKLDDMTTKLDPHTNLIDVAKIIFILAFRCGLRRNEALKY